MGLRAVHYGLILGIIALRPFIATAAEEDCSRYLVPDISLSQHDLSFYQYVYDTLDESHYKDNKKAFEAAFTYANVPYKGNYQEDSSEFQKKYALTKEVTTDTQQLFDYRRYIGDNALKATQECLIRNAGEGILLTLGEVTDQIVGLSVEYTPPAGGAGMLDVVVGGGHACPVDVTGAGKWSDAGRINVASGVRGSQVFSVKRPTRTDCLVTVKSMNAKYSKQIRVTAPKSAPAAAGECAAFIQSVIANGGQLKLFTRVTDATTNPGSGVPRNDASELTLTIDAVTSESGQSQQFVGHVRPRVNNVPQDAIVGTLNGPQFSWTRIDEDGITTADGSCYKQGLHGNLATRVRFPPDKQYFHTWCIDTDQNRCPAL